MSSKSNSEVSAEFQAYYLQRATKELAEDLDKVRNADDFKNDAIPMLIAALQQGTGMFSPEEKRRIVGGEKGEAKAEESS